MSPEETGVGGVCRHLEEKNLMLLWVVHICLRNGKETSVAGGPEFQAGATGRSVLP
jgi:hypothetical protein